MRQDKNGIYAFQICRTESFRLVGRCYLDQGKAVMRRGFDGLVIERLDTDELGGERWSLVGRLDDMCADNEAAVAIGALLVESNKYWIESQLQEIEETEAAKIEPAIPTRLQMIETIKADEA